MDYVSEYVLSKLKFYHDIVMGRVPENLTRPEGFLAAQTQPEPKKTFANPKNPKITNIIYLKTRNKPEKRLENPTQT